MSLIVLIQAGEPGQKKQDMRILHQEKTRLKKSRLPRQESI